MFLDVYMSSCFYNLGAGENTAVTYEDTLGFITPTLGDVNAGPLG